MIRPYFWGGGTSGGVGWPVMRYGRLWWCRGKSFGGWLKDFEVVSGWGFYKLVSKDIESIGRYKAQKICQLSVLWKSSVCFLPFCTVVLPLKSFWCRPQSCATPFETWKNNGATPLVFTNIGKFFYMMPTTWNLQSIYLKSLEVQLASNFRSCFMKHQLFDVRHWFISCKLGCSHTQ